MAVVPLNVTTDCTDPARVAAFWAAATDGTAAEHRWDEFTFWVVEPAAAGPRLVFLAVPELRTVKNRVHMDLRAAAGSTQASELERLLELGAHIVDDRREAEPGGWIVMADVEGNEFCLEGDPD